MPELFDFYARPDDLPWAAPAWARSPESQPVGLLDLLDRPETVLQPLQSSPDWAALLRYLGLAAPATSAMSWDSPGLENLQDAAWAAPTWARSPESKPAGLLDFINKPETVLDPFRSSPYSAALRSYLALAAPATSAMSWGSPGLEDLQDATWTALASSRSEDSKPTGLLNLIDRPETALEPLRSSPYSAALRSYLTLAAPATSAMPWGSPRLENPQDATWTALASSRSEGSKPASLLDFLDRPRDLPDQDRALPRWPWSSGEEQIADVLPDSRWPWWPSGQNRPESGAPNVFAANYEQGRKPRGLLDFIDQPAHALPALGRTFNGPGLADRPSYVGDLNAEEQDHPQQQRFAERRFGSQFQLQMLTQRASRDVQRFDRTWQP